MSLFLSVRLFFSRLRSSLPFSRLLLVLLLIFLSVTLYSYFQTLNCSSVQATWRTSPSLTSASTLPSPRISFNSSSGSSSRSPSSTSSFTSPLSPGLSYCTANPFLVAYDWAEVEKLEHEYLEWKNTQFHSLYALMLDYYYHDGFDADAAKIPDEGKFTYENEVGRMIHKVVYPEKYTFPCPYNGGMKVFGEGVGIGKRICGLDEYGAIRDRHRAKYPQYYQNRDDANAKCQLFSLGSNNLFSFESAISSRTECNIFTFDCTSDPPTSSIPRLNFHKRCLGEPTPAGQPNRNLQLKLFPYRRPPPGWGSADQRQYIERVRMESYSDIVKDIGLDHVDVLKIDVEGAEYAVFVDLLKDSKRAPYQIVFESHWWFLDVGHATLTLRLFEEFWRLGYRITFREDQDDKSCFEWSLMRVFC